MKVLIVTDYHNKTGSGKQNYQLYTELNAMWHQAEMFNLVSPQGFWETPEYGQNSVTRYFLYGVFWKFRADLGRHLAENTYDAIFLWQHGLSYLHGTLKKSGQPFVVSIADLFPLDWRYTNWWDVRYWLYNACMLRPFRKFENVVFISDYTKESYRQVTGKLPLKHATIHIGTHFPEEMAKSAGSGTGRDWKTEFGGKPVILQVWSIDKRKNAAVFYRIAKAMAEKYGDRYEFVRVGKFPKDLDPSYDTYVRRYQRISEADLIGLFAYAKAFVLTSLAEGFGVPVAEARSVWLPVVSTKVSDMERICQGDEWTRFVDDPNDESEYVACLEQFLSDPREGIPFPYPERLSVREETKKFLEFFERINGNAI